MTPETVYSAPTQRTTPWWDALDVVECLFEDTGVLVDAIDVDLAENCRDARIVVDQKIQHIADMERSAALYSVSLDGAPFAVMKAAGRGERDQQDVLVTDAHLYREAFKHVMQFHNTLTRSLAETPANTETTFFDDLYGYQVIPDDNGGVELAQPGSYTRDGRPLFDRQKCAAAFDDLFLGDQAHANRINDPATMVLVTDALSEAVADGMEVHRVQSWYRPKDETGTFWIGIAVRDPQTGTVYTVGAENRVLQVMGPATLGAQPLVEQEDPEFLAWLGFEEPEPTLTS